MKKLLSIVLLVVGLAFLLQAGILMGLFLAESRKNVDPTDYDDVRLSVVEFRTGQMVSSVVGSLTGCFGLWLLLLYLKTRRLERQISELRGQAQRNKQIPPVSPP